MSGLRHRRSPSRVVIVEDNPVTRKVLRVTLESGGYQVAEASDGRSGFELVQSLRPDLVLLDYRLPDMTGVELCQRIRRTPHGRDLPVILVSGHVREVDLAASPFTACLIKPFEPSRLLEVLKTILVDKDVPRPPPMRQGMNFYGAALSVMSAISEVLSRPANGSSVLGDVLLHCLDALGIAGGALFLRASGGELRFHSQAGLSAKALQNAARAFDAPEVLERIHADARIILSESGDAAEERFLNGVGHSAALLIPLIILGESRGVLVLGADPETLIAAEWQAFARALGSQLGQVVALGQAADEAREFEELIRQAIDASPGGFLMVDAGGGIVLANPMIEQIFGYTEAELKGQPVEILLPPSLREQHVADRAQFLSGPVRRKMGSGRDLLGRHKSGLRVPVEIGLAPVTRGENRYVIATVIDITERLRAQEAVRRGAQTLAAAQELAHLGSYEFDPATGEGSVSLELNRIFGREAAADPPHFPSVLLEFVHPDDLPRVRASVLNALAGGATDQPDVYRILRPDGATRWVKASRRVERDPGGALLRVSAAILDITEYRDAVAAAGTATARLEALSRRLLDIQESERRQLARELHDEIGQALTAAQMTVQSIARFPDEPKLPERLNEAIVVIGRALNLVRSLTLQLRPPLIDELGLVPALRWLVEQCARAGGANVQFAHGGLTIRPPPEVEIACFRIAQEAMSNVMRHSRASHVNLAVGADAGTLFLTVKDDGLGFDVAHAISRAEHGGSLGMVGIEERAGLAGGTVRWRSQPGHGTEVRAEFPMKP